MNSLSKWIMLGLCFAPAAHACRAEENAQFSQTLLKDLWAVHYAGTASAELIRFTPVTNTIDNRAQVEWVLARYPDGMARTTRIFPLPDGAGKPTAAIIDPLLAEWSTAGGVMDLHTVPGSGQRLLRAGRTSEYVAFPEKRLIFDKPSDGFMPHLIARALLDADPWVHMANEGDTMRVQVRGWGVTLWLDSAVPVPRIVRVQQDKPNGEWALRHEYGEFRSVRGYPGEVPFSASVFANSGAWRSQDGVDHPAGPRLIHEWQLHSFVARAIDADEFRPVGSPDDDLRITPFNSGKVRIVTTGTPDDHSVNADAQKSSVPSSDSQTGFSVSVQTWLWSSGALAVLIAYGVWMWSRRRG